MQIEEVRISRRATIPERIHFYLNSELLQHIAQVRDNHQQLALPPKILNSLRYYALLNFPLEKIGLINPRQVRTHNYCSKLLLTFDTDYLDIDSGRSQTVLRSNINLEGKISQQIHQDLCHNPQLLEQISEVHYWLILEIMAQLPFKSKNLYSWLVFICLLSLVYLPILFINYFFSLGLLVNLIIFLSVLVFCNSWLKNFIIKQLKFWIICHLSNSLWLKNSTRSRQIILQILALIA
ncbi:MAG: hypothetical protein AAGF83_04150 [Cyanobacteria bacterium P01_G01_bin.67]